MEPGLAGNSESAEPLQKAPALSPVHGGALGLKEREQAPEQVDRGRRAAADMEVDGHDLRDASDDRIAAGEKAAVDGAVADRHDPFRVRRRLTGAPSASRMFLVTGPVTSSTSAWRGEATKRMPNRSRS